MAMLTANVLRYLKNFPPVTAGCALHFLKICTVRSWQEKSCILLLAPRRSGKDHLIAKRHDLSFVAGLQVWGNLVGFIERLNDELFKSLQVLDPHTNLYLERMKDEPLFLALAQKV